MNHVDRDYREAMAELLQLDDLRAVLAAQDICRRYLGIAAAIVAVADRLLFVVLREPQTATRGAADRRRGR